MAEPQQKLPSLKRSFIKVEHSFLTRPAYWTGVIIAVTSFVTHYYQLHLPDRVTWDEAHFGRFANFYIKREYYFDVHPPLGKMLIALVGVLTGYDGNFPFETKGGPEYGDAHYLGMRVLCASMGAALPLLVYGIMLNLRYSLEAAVLAAACVLFDTGMLTLTRYILLDAPLLFFVLMSTYFYTRFLAYSHRPFTFPWWTWLAGTGICLACTMGTKWVGLFTVALVGYGTIIELWDMLGDKHMPLKSFSHHFLARSLCLIFLPIALYVSFFYIHFAVLSNSGPGDNTMGAAFQVSLHNNTLRNTTGIQYLPYGSRVSLRAHQCSGMLLHSHPEAYPKDVGPEQQQVTTYTITDFNNMWVFKHPDIEDNESGEVEYVLHGDVVRLEHAATRRNLHTHPNHAPLSIRQHQVTGYLIGDQGDVNDQWVVQLDGVFTPPSKVKRLLENGEDTEPYRVQWLNRPFRLKHRNLNCYLCATQQTLPKWGYEQGEVTCNPSREVGTLWTLESVADQREGLPEALSNDLTQSFWRSLYDAHAVMTYTNNKMIPKADDTPCHPFDWLLLLKGQHFNSFEENRLRIYLLGNPAVWLGLCLPSLALFVVLYLCSVLVCQRLGWVSADTLKGQTRQVAAGCWRIFRKGGFLFAGYLFHYVPFFIMGRILYYHHYFAAQLFACMIVGAVFNEVALCLYQLGVRWRLANPKLPVQCAMLVLLTLIASVFVLFSPLSYGMVGPKKNYSYLRWRDQWHVDQ